MNDQNLYEETYKYFLSSILSYYSINTVWLCSDLIGSQPIGIFLLGIPMSYNSVSTIVSDLVLLLNTLVF